ncbi:hypothetical protein [Aurantiacibacter odishensis]|uniref:hypothetical protein n=1 Tax=Aurantiacibacter odishensis TaxID=1155476 RepID=UPI000E760335|nr:hypothetical protein [Aurantiacibacter odishensis]
MSKLFKRALIYAVLWTAWMFCLFSLMEWIGWWTSSAKGLQFWLMMAASMTVLTLISIPLDERFNKRRDHRKRMKKRNFQ